LDHFFSGQVGVDFERLRKCFPDTWDVYVLGGIIRNLLLNELRGIELENGDVDVVINGAATTGDLQSKIQDFIVRQNEFGGAKCRLSYEGLLFDVWRLDDHVSLSITPGPHTLLHLLQHNVIDVDAVVWEPKTDLLHDYGCIRAIRRGRIELIKDGIACDFAPAQVAHILIVAAKTGFELSQEAANFIRDVCSDNQKQTEVAKVLRRKAPDIVSPLEKLLPKLLEGEARSWTSLTVYQNLPINRKSF
jgi:hypothetical protein